MNSLHLFFFLSSRNGKEEGWPIISPALLEMQEAAAAEAAARVTDPASSFRDREKASGSVVEMGSCCPCGQFKIRYIASQKYCNALVVYHFFQGKRICSAHFCINLFSIFWRKLGRVGVTNPPSSMMFPF